MNGWSQDVTISCIIQWIDRCVRYSCRSTCIPGRGFNNEWMNRGCYIKY